MKRLEENNRYHDFNSSSSHIPLDSSVEHFRKCIVRKLCLDGNEVISCLVLYWNGCNTFWFMSIISRGMSNDFCVVIELDNISNILSLHGNNGDTIVEPTNSLSTRVKSKNTIVGPSNLLSVKKWWGFDNNFT